jgi:hypothetical protein
MAILLLLLTACAERGSQSEAPAPCTEPWYQAVEQNIPSGDGMGHGPDIGSEEWKSVVEFKLGVRGNPDVPGRASSAWCLFIDDLLFGNAEE